MLDDLAGLIASIGGSSSGEESDGMKFLGCLFVTVCAGGGCLLFLAFAGHGFYSDDAISLVADNLKIAAILALVTIVFGYITARWFRDDAPKEGSK